MCVQAVVPIDIDHGPNLAATDMTHVVYVITNKHSFVFLMCLDLTL